MQLKDTNKTIQGLCEEVNRLQKEDLEKKKELEEKIFQLSLDNQALKGKIDLLQMRLDIYNTPMFHSQPVLPFASSRYPASQPQPPSTQSSESSILPPSHFASGPHANNQAQEP